MVAWSGFLDSQYNKKAVLQSVLKKIRTPYQYFQASERSEKNDDSVFGFRFVNDKKICVSLCSRSSE